MQIYIRMLIKGKSIDKGC